MIRNAETIAMTVLLIGVHCPQALGQQPPPAILTIDVDNVVEYQGGYFRPINIRDKSQHYALGRGKGI